jgi:XTP/dITP diphosphohydrolase
MKLIFATNNQHKVEEIRSVIAPGVLEIITLNEAGIPIDIPEPFDTIEENARHKAKTIYQLSGLNCFSEDTGLEVEALGGEPGVRSARYAGDERAFDQNIDKLLRKLSGHANRKARFRTVIALILDGEETLFEGTCNGEIAEKRNGEGGFGYDAVFIPEGSDRSFGEMSLGEKNGFSHRKKATEKLINFLSARFANQPE